MGQAPVASRVIERAAHPAPAFVQHMGIDHRRFHILVSQQLLDRPNVIAIFQQVGSETMAQRMARDAVGEGQALGRASHCSLKTTFIQVMATESPAAGIGGRLLGGEDIRPAPFPFGIGELACQGIGQVNRAIALPQVFLVYSLHLLEVVLQRGDQDGGQHRAAVFLAFAVAHGDLAIGDVQVFDPQA